MDKMIGYCGLICTDCPAYIATQSDDGDALEAVAAQWSEEFDLSLTADECLCDGCLATTGREMVHCSECKIRACARGKSVRNCAHCSDYPCPTLNEFLAMAPAAKSTLEAVRRTL